MPCGDYVCLVSNQVQWQSSSWHAFLILSRTLSRIRSRILSSQPNVKHHLHLKAIRRNPFLISTQKQSDGIRRTLPLSAALWVSVMISSPLAFSCLWQQRDVHRRPTRHSIAVLSGFFTGSWWFSFCSLASTMSRMKALADTRSSLIVNGPRGCCLNARARCGQSALTYRYWLCKKKLQLRVSNPDGAFSFRSDKMTL